jgi:uncharacterized protein YdeI (BOF family)
MRFVLLISLGALLAGCSGGEGRILGVLLSHDAIPVSAVQSTSPESSVVVRGTMTQKCPVAGCWFMLHDATGTIKVDTRNAGFSVVDVPLRTALLVAGRVTTNGTDRIIEASGIRY